MAVTYPLSLPFLPTPQQLVLSEIDVIGINQSPFNLAQEVQDWGANAWAAHLDFSRVPSRAKAAAIRSTLTALRGSFGTILLGDPLGATPRGSAAATPGTPVVNGAVAAGATSLSLRGLPASATGYLLADDYLQLGSGATTRLYKVIDASVNSDGSGDATFDIWPFIREGYADGAAVTLTNCVGTFRLMGAKRDWTQSPPTVYAGSFDFIEAL